MISNSLGLVKAPCGNVVDNTDHCQQHDCSKKSQCISWKNFVSELGDTLPNEVKL